MFFWFSRKKKKLLVWLIVNERRFRLPFLHFFSPFNISYFLSFGWYGKILLLIPILYYLSLVIFQSLFYYLEFCFLYSLTSLFYFPPIPNFFFLFFFSITYFKYPFIGWPVFVYLFLSVSTSHSHCIVNVYFTHEN